MSTGPEHYREAERLLTEAHNAAQRVLPVMAARADAAGVYANVMARAQVHATLALAAAVAANRAVGPLEQWGGHAVEVSGEWREVTGQ